MSFWLDILRLAADGNSSEAERLLSFELPLVLRTPEVKREGGWHYTGPLARKARIFIASLPEGERAMALSRTEDFIDYVADLILAKVRRTLRLLQFSLKHPEHSISQIAEEFSGWDGLKRSLPERIEWIKKHFRSMSAAGITLSSIVTEEIQGDTSSLELYGYHELALVNQWKLELSWKAFKAQEEIDRNYLCITDLDSEEDTGVADEALDYGGLTAAEVVLNLSAPSGSELDADFRQLGTQLTAELLELLEAFNTNRPSDGYRPIARHNVWWNLISKYVIIPFTLAERDPFCETDNDLAEHIGKNYADVVKPTRLNVFRRRTRLQNKCFDHAQSVLISWANSTMS